jgi:hypothetical protein
VNLNQLLFYLSSPEICTIGQEHRPPFCRNGSAILFCLPMTTDAEKERRMMWIILIIYKIVIFVENLQQDL